MSDSCQSDLLIGITAGANDDGTDVLTELGGAEGSFARLGDLHGASIFEVEHGKGASDHVRGNDHTDERNTVQPNAVVAVASDEDREADDDGDEGEDDERVRPFHESYCAFGPLVKLVDKGGDVDADDKQVADRAERDEEANQSAPQAVRVVHYAVSPRALTIVRT